MSHETIARRYGTALADVVIKTGETETVRSELRSWETMIKSNADLTNAFSSPAIPHANKEKVLNSLLQRTSPSKTTSNFLRVLLNNGRLGELGEITNKLDSILEERSGIVTAQITSAHEIHSEEKAEFKKTLEKLTGKTVNLNFNIDSALIGGVVTRIGSQVYDGSVRSKLENLKEQLVSG